jgi:hypothetical protein
LEIGKIDFESKKKIKILYVKAYEPEMDRIFG